MTYFGKLEMPFFDDDNSSVTFGSLMYEANQEKDESVVVTTETIAPDDLVENAIAFNGIVRGLEL